MSGRIFPTMRQLVLATIVGLASHPRIQNPGIYYVGSSKEEKIVAWRAFGGYELEEEGLVCSVYPAYSSKTANGSPPPLSKQKSIQLKPYTLGTLGDSGSLEDGTYTLIIELSYRDANFGDALRVNYDQLRTQEGLPPLTPHGLNVMAHDGLGLDLATDDLEAFQPNLEGISRTREGLTVLISPAEELLREYTELIRLALNDLFIMRPFTVRSAQVTSIDFPTSSWSRKSEDILFHTAYLVWELTLYPPTHWKDIYFLPIQNLELTTEVKQ